MYVYEGSRYNSNTMKDIEDGKKEEKKMRENENIRK